EISKSQQPVVIRRENDRYWILDVHPTLNLLAAGHDSGLVVFKLYRERPPMDIRVDSKLLYYVKENYVYEHAIRGNKEVAIMATRKRASSAAGGSGSSLTTGQAQIKNLVYNSY